jgi:general secretion pathway protein A
MYEAFFGLTQEPFSIAPDQRFLFLSDKHREALALLEDGVRRGAGFVLLTGEIGAGKTTVWRRFLNNLPSNFDIANVVNPRLDVHALLTRVCEDLHVELPSGGAVDLIDALHGHLLLTHAQGRRTLIVIDEAQALSLAVMEQLRLLTNLDSSGRKLIVLLIGQPELRGMLEQPPLEPLAQRIATRYHLGALEMAETVAYVEHRLKVAGLTGPMPFEPEALVLLQRLSRGVPRRINVLCDRALVKACEQAQRRVGAEHLQRAAADTLGTVSASASAPETVQAAMPSPLWALAAIGLVGLVLGTWFGARVLATRPTVTVAAPRETAAAADRPEAPAAPSPPASLAAATLPAPGVLASAFAAPGGSSAHAAWSALGARWGVRLDTADPCATAAALDLVCYRSQGGLAPIRTLQRPGIVRLVNASGRMAFALLTAIDGERVRLEIDGVQLEFPLTELAQYWKGDFETLWRAPAGYREGVLPGDGGALDRWLVQRLPADRSPIPGASASAALQARVATFQLARGLAPDGLAGPLTLMQLNRISGVTEPRLDEPAAR